MNPLVAWACGVGASVGTAGRDLYDLVTLFGAAVRVAVFPGRRGAKSLRNQIVGQILYTGVEAFLLVSAIGLISGVTIVIQAMTNMPRIGVGQYFGKILKIAVVRELGPFFTALVVIGRSGTALAAYIGNMRVGREISALEVMGVDPLHFLVVPALWGIVISMVCLNVYFAIVAIAGGLLVAHGLGVSANIPIVIFTERVLQALVWQDVLVSMVKALLFGLVVATVSCHYGLKVKVVREVPQASIKSVVVSMVAMIGFNIIVTVFSYVFWNV